MLRGIVIVIGTGWAGEGYVTALRQADVEVVALCGRSLEPAHAMGARLGIADIGRDWQSAIDELSPDIVVVATPAEPHCEMVEYAAERGAHVVCEKPLGRNADEGRRMLTAVERAGVKHAYGTTTRLEGHPWFNRLQHFTTDDNQWVDVAIPTVDDPIQSGWNQLVAHLVSDIKGTKDSDYPTFRDGYAANLLIDQVRAADGVAGAPTG